MHLTIPSLLATLILGESIRQPGNFHQDLKEALLNEENVDDKVDSAGIELIQLKASTLRLPAAPVHRSPVSLVNVLAGTNARSDLSSGNTLPIVARPWGFNHWAVQSRDTGDAFWFTPGDVDFIGLRCTHQPSPWIGDYGHFLVVPFFSGMDGNACGSTSAGMYQPAQTLFRPYSFRTSVMSTYDETKGSIEMEMTPSMHGALFRVAVPRGESGGLRFTLPQDDEYNWQDMGNGVMHGLTASKSTSPSGDYPSNFGMYVVIEPADGQKVQWQICSGSGTALLTLPSKDGASRLVRLSTSFISAKQARVSMNQELKGKTFSGLTKESKQEWNELMERVQVEFEDEARAAVFYTNLYRGMLFPRFFWETNEAGSLVHFSAYNGKVLPGRAVTDQGFWDAYRTVYPMLSVIFPDKMGEMTEGWVNAYKEAGWLPTWSSPAQRTCMVGTMGDCSLADAVVKNKQGLMSGFNASEAYAAILHDAMEKPDQNAKSFDLGRSALMEYDLHGYVPSDSEDADNANSQTAALTLNYQLADACVANAAEAMGDHSAARVLRKRSKMFSKLFDNSTKYFRPRTQDGCWDGPYGGRKEEIPVVWGSGFTEAAAAQYRFYVPHDVEGLAKLFGGKVGLCKEIQAMMEKSEGPGTDFRSGTYGQVIHEMREGSSLEGGFGLYGHNNQPVHHVLWVAAEAGCSELSQRYLRKVMDQLYTIDGWAGDEDNGEMASWYILASLGIYSLVPGSDNLVLGSPEVTAATITVPGRKQLRIEANGNSADNVYVANVAWNGEKVQGVHVQYSNLAKGGTLSFNMATKPDVM